MFECFKMKNVTNAHTNELKRKRQFEPLAHRSKRSSFELALTVIRFSFSVFKMFEVVYPGRHLHFNTNDGGRVLCCVSSDVFLLPRGLSKTIPHALERPASVRAMRFELSFYTQNDGTKDVFGLAGFVLHLKCMGRSISE